MSWTILGVNEWSASDASDGLPVSGTRAWPSAGNTAGDVGIMTIVARDTATPPTGTGDWTLIDSYTSGDTDTNGLRNCWVYRHVRGGSDPSVHDTWVTSYAGGIVVYRHSSETTFSFGTPVQQAFSTGSTTHSLSAGVTSPGTDSLIFVAAFNGRASPSAIAATAPATGASSEDSTTAPSTSAWYYRHARSSAATPGAVFAAFDAVLNSGNTGAIETTQLSTKGVLIAFSIQPGAADTTAPTLSSGTATETSDTTATLGATTDEGNGTLYWVITTSATEPSAAQVKAGDDHADAAAAYADSDAVGSTGAKTNNATGLTASTTYYGYAMHEDAASNQSDVLYLGTFTSDAAASPPGTPSTPAFDNITKTGYRVTWSAPGSGGTVSGYEYRIDAGSWVDVGTDLEVTISGRTPGATDTVEARAYGPGGDGTASTADITLPLYGFAFSTASGLVFGAIVGALTDIEVEAEDEEWTVFVHDDEDRSIVLTGSAVTIDAAGRLPDMTSATLDAGAYFVSFRRTDGAWAAARLTTEDLS